MYHASQIARQLAGENPCLLERVSEETPFSVVARDPLPLHQLCSVAKVILLDLGASVPASSSGEWQRIAMQARLQVSAKLLREV